MRDEDADRVLAIYRDGIATGEATFETKTPTWEAWDAAHLKRGRLVAEEGGSVVGWAALAPVSARRAYAGVAEVSVYVDSYARGRGIGDLLLRSLIRASEDAGLWTLQAGILGNNERSLKLHLATGFRLVGTRERIGKLQGTWRDVLLLERRSKKVGFD